MAEIILQGKVLFYYCNPAGYMEGEKLIIDCMFQNNELKLWLEAQNLGVPEFREGVFDHLITLPLEELGTEVEAPAVIPRKAESKYRCRLWQLKPETDLALRFKDYSELSEPPALHNYRVAFDGGVSSHNLDAIYDEFLEKQPQGAAGNPVNISDIIEIYGRDAHEFYYIGKTSFYRVEGD